MVLDEYGGVVGLVTIEDLIEELLVKLEMNMMMKRIVSLKK